MSLTGLLRKKDNAVRAAFDEMFPVLSSAFLKRPVNGETPTRIRKEPTRVLPAEVARYPWQTVGTAFDYRMRYLINPKPADDLVAFHGGRLLASMLGSNTVPPAMLELSERIGALLSPATLGQPLIGQSERELARLCYTLALYEQCSRRTPNPEWPIAALGLSASLTDVTALCTQVVEDDMVALAELAVREVPALFTGGTFSLNPTFVGSGFVGGADGDFIVDGQIIELKTAKVPNLTEGLRQTLGYALLDWEDKHAITSVGMYLARQGQLITWDLECLLESISGHSMTLAQARAEFMSACEGHFGMGYQELTTLAELSERAKEKKRVAPPFIPKAPPRASLVTRLRARLTKRESPTDKF
jgi:hypothetical protein